MSYKKNEVDSPRTLPFPAQFLILPALVPIDHDERPPHAQKLRRQENFESKQGA
jgi:hypothetical protein